LKNKGAAMFKITGRVVLILRAARLPNLFDELIEP
jgi:hypothetical protein